MPAHAQSRTLASEAPQFASGAMVLLSLSAPREKYWGMVLELAPAGISLRGLELSWFEDFVRQIKAGDHVMPNALFFPMHRVERMELDACNGEIPSLQGRFLSKCGVDFRKLIAGNADEQRQQS